MLSGTRSTFVLKFPMGRAIVENVGKEKLCVWHDCISSRSIESLFLFSTFICVYYVSVLLSGGVFSIQQFVISLCYSFALRDR